MNNHFREYIINYHCGMVQEVEHMVFGKVVWCWGAGLERSPWGSEICRKDGWASAGWRGGAEYSRQRAQCQWIPSGGKEHDRWGMEESSVTRSGRKARKIKRVRLHWVVCLHIFISVLITSCLGLFYNFCVGERWHACSVSSVLGRRSFQLLPIPHSVQHRAGNIVGAQ